MAATPQFGTMIFKGMSGMTYVKDIYMSDVNGSPVRFDGGAGAGAASPDYMTLPEDSYLIDVSIVTGLTDTTKFRLTSNGIPSAHLLRYTIHLTTIATRPPLAIGLSAGNRFGAIQLT